MTFDYFLRRSAFYWPEAIAVMQGTRSLSYRLLESRSNRLANALLGLGLRPGDRVAVQSRNAIELVEVECALYKAGLVKAAVNPRLTVGEVRSVIEECSPRAWMAGGSHVALGDGYRDAPSITTRIAFGAASAGFLDYEDLIAASSDRAPHVEISRDALAVLHFSSGSTGKIKAAMHSYGNRLASLRKILAGAEYPVQPGDRLALIGPITHASGMLMQPYLFAGATLVLYDRFEPEEFLRSVSGLGITRGFMVPTMINMLLDSPELSRSDLGPLRTLTYGAAPMAPARIVEAWERIGPVLSQGYGASETTSGVTRLSIAEHAHAIASQPRLLASCGRPGGESEVLVVDGDGRPVAPGDIGEIVVRGEDVFQGYWNAPELTASVLRDGWLHTGDLAKIDDDGYIYLVDRRHDMIISGGFNVYPNEIESVLYGHPAVHEVCVIGVPDERWGEAVRAVVVAKRGASQDSHSVIDFCRARMADYKAPRAVDWVDALPKNPNGKISRKEVREKYWGEQQRRVH